MNILIISLAFAPYSGVGSARMTSLSRYLVQEGNTVTVLCYDANTFAPENCLREVPSGVKCVVVDYGEKKENIRKLKQALLQLLSKDKYDLAILSVGPFEAMYLINSLYRKKVPYIIDYRDPWLFNEVERKFSISAFKTLVHDILNWPYELICARKARRIVFVSPASEMAYNKYCRFQKSKTCIIPNGYESFFISANERKDFDVYKIGIPGKCSYYNPTMGRALLEFACASPKPLLIEHVGNPELDMINAGCPSYQYLGFKDYSETMNIMNNTDLIAIGNNLKRGLGTKIFDAIILNKPVLYMGVVPSELSEFVSKFENGYVCSTKEELDITLLKIMNERPRFLTNQSIERYSRDSQNEIYYKLIKDSIG